MKRIVIILISVVTIIAVAGGLVYWFLDSSSLEIPVEEIPCGLEWGMNKEEVRAVLESANYKELEAGRLINYEIQNLYDLEGINCIIYPTFTNDEETLTSVIYMFSNEEASEAPGVPSEIYEELKSAFEKAYEKNCEEMYVDKESLMPGNYYLYKGSLVSIKYMMNMTTFVVNFSSLEEADNQQILEELRNAQ